MARQVQSSMVLRWVGVSPLIMNHPRGIDKNDPLVKAKDEIQKRAKTDQQALDLADADWRVGLYCDETGPYISEDQIMGSLIAGSKMAKQGKLFKAGLVSIEGADGKKFGGPRAYLEYDGPRDIEGLLVDPRFRDRRAVKIGQSRIMKTRPMFREWAVQFRVTWNPDIIKSAQDVLTAAQSAGVCCGVGDYRPRFGRYDATEVK